MIDIKDNQKQRFLEDSIDKKILINVDSTIDNSRLLSVNFYTGDVFDDDEISQLVESTTGGATPNPINNNPLSWRLSEFQNNNYYKYGNYVNLSFNLRVFKTASDSVVAPKAQINVEYHDGKGVFHSKIIDDITSNYETDSGKEVNFFFDGNDITDIISIYVFVWGSDSYKIGKGISKLQIRVTNSNEPVDYVRSIIHDGISINDYIGEIVDNITNVDLDQESFSLTESLCSQDNLKFGLCESAHCEFTVVGRSDNFNNKTIRPYIGSITEQDFDYSNINFDTGNFNGSTWWNTTNIRYYKSLDTPTFNNNYVKYANYVMVVAKIQIGMTVRTGDTIPPKFYFGMAVKDQNGSTWRYALRHSNVTNTGSDRLSIYDTNDFLYDTTSDNKEVYVTLPTDLSFDSKVGLKINQVVGFYVLFADENGNMLTSDLEVDDFRIYHGSWGMYFVDSINAPVIHYDASLKISGKIPESLKGVPLGVFKVSEVKKNHTNDILKKSITAYDGLSILEQDVGDWLTKYMWIWDTGNKRASDSPYFTRFGVEYSRQLFPTLANLMKQLNILSDDDFTEIFNFADVDVSPANYGYGYDYLWGDYGDAPRNKGTVGLLWGSSGSAGFSEDRLMRIDLTPYGGLTDAELFGRFAYSDMSSTWDSNYHGFPSCASVFVELNYSDGSSVKIVADSGDYIYISKNVTSFSMKYSAGIASINPSGTMYAYGDKNRMLVTHMKGTYYEVPDILKNLVNAHLRLVYYNYGTQEMGSFSSSVSGRDVIRSLLEVNGCFFHMNRYGKPEIIYSNKAGLYPSKDLYPSNELYPRGNRGLLLDMNKYISFECDDYEVQRIGRIQIKTESQVKSGESICSYEYVGDENAKNTYIIEDNIFYCASGTVYEYGSQPEVDEMLKNLFSIISNLNYTPHTTQLRGLPFMECGDRINLITKTGGIESFIFRRKLKGINALRDTYEANGDEYIEPINTFDYKVYQPS